MLHYQLEKRKNLDNSRWSDLNKKLLSLMFDKKHIQLLTRQLLTWRVQ